VRRALVVLEKEWLDLRMQRGLLFATLVLPPAITLLAVAGFFAAGRLAGNLNTAGAPLPHEFAGLERSELGQALIGRQFSVIFMLLPVFVPSVLAAYAIVGEKRDRTLEPLLATPIETWQLLLGKVLASLVPALVITLLSAALFVAGVLLFAVTGRVAALIVTPGWLVAILVDAPLLALIGIALIVVVSSRVNDPRTAQQFSAVLVVPVLLLLFGQLSGVIVLGPALAISIAVVLAAVGVGALWLASRLFQREAILTRWR
jgi:ABC-2 type transport system permease protein